MVGYTVQTGDSGEEGMAKGAINTRQLKRNRTEQMTDHDAVQDGFFTSCIYYLYQFSMHFRIERA